jgi:hypothetical protein
MRATTLRPRETAVLARRAVFLAAFFTLPAARAPFFRDFAALFRVRVVAAFLVRLATARVFFTADAARLRARVAARESVA